MVTKRIILLLSIAALAVISCKKAESGDSVPPVINSVFPANGATRVSITSWVYITYSEDVELASNYVIKVNGSAKTATASGKQVRISVTLAEGTVYNVSVSAKSVMDLSGNFAPGISFSFTTIYGQPTDGKYEAEYGTMSSTNSILTASPGFSGTGYVGGFHNSSDYVTVNMENITAGKYDLYVGYSTSNYGAKVCNVDVNGIAGAFSLDASTSFIEKKFATVVLSNGSNTVKVSANWTWFLIDYIRIAASSGSGTVFNISANLVTPGPSAQAVNLYNYLKTNFLTNVISGTMANYSTNIDEAQWVHDNTTGNKWPALTCFDFIDHTIRGSSTIKYEAPFNLGKTWWDNNGIVALMWHWRDPLNKGGAFYTANTTFDVSKISDTGSNEYKEMLKDIDTIAVYLKEFKNANIPVIWRPLHEAAGGWFWWGAKGAAPCKALWQLMYDRLVNYHGLNNLIWVWTTNTSSDALDWYPGDSYVDIIGMDIYPGEYQHNTQYYEFNRVKDMFGGKKIITLSECGSVPDPAQMKTYGDMWSWFMPWNGDYTRSSAHNGVSWWNSFFSNSYVITRDKMPDLH